MSDVFLSYVLTDRVFVEQLVAGLEEQGFTAFSDARRIHACILDKGTVVEAERSKVVAVVWSTSSVKSPWVQSEALIGLNRDKLLSISIDDAATPKPFSGTHAVSIKDRSSDADGIAHVIKAMKAQLKGEAWVSTPTPSKSSPSKPAPPESKAPASELQTKASSKTADVAKPKPKGRMGLLLEIVKTSMAAGGFAMVNYAGYEWLRDSTGALDFIVVLGASIALTLAT
ncbi:MAG: toll/interleukin-1 receptor domain-containing protein, partial [Myxococcota bacterium]